MEQKSAPSYWNKVENFCFMKASKAAVSTLPGNDFILRCFTLDSCPQPFRCFGNAIVVTLYSFVWAIMLGPYLIIDTLFVKPKLYKLYKRYLIEGHEVSGSILFMKPTENENNSIKITLVGYNTEGKYYVKYVAHGCCNSDEIEDSMNVKNDRRITLLILPRHPKSACSKSTVELYLERHSYYHCISMILWAVGLTMSVSIGIALSLKYEFHEGVSITLWVMIPAALFLVCLYLFLRKDPVQTFLLESARELPDKELGELSCEQKIVGDLTVNNVMQPTLEYFPSTQGYFSGVSSKAFDDLWEGGNDELDSCEEYEATVYFSGVPSKALDDLWDGGNDELVSCEEYEATVCDVESSASND